MAEGGGWHDGVAKVDTGSHLPQEYKVVNVEEFKQRNTLHKSPPPRTTRTTTTTSPPGNVINRNKM
jgi:hypothetical protein